MKRHQPSEHLASAPWLVLFDGVCGWCTGWVQFLVKHDSQKRFQFAPLQSPLGQQLLAAYNLSQTNFSTLVVVTPYGYMTQSTAVLNIACHLGGMWRLLYLFIFVPKILRDGLYNLAARYRYQLRGTLTICYQSAPEDHDRFRYEV